MTDLAATERVGAQEHAHGISFNEAIFRFNVGMLVVLAASCITGILLRAAGVI